MKVLITGGSGFIGSNLIRYFLEHYDYKILNIDALTYASNPNSLNDISSNSLYSFEKVNLCDREKVDAIISSFQPDIVMHLAAESHVDKSLERPSDFINSNIIGTFNILESCREFLNNSYKSLKGFTFHHISTDEVFGDINFEENPATEISPYKPSSPYSASKASSDHLVRAWIRSYDFPAVITNCSNNYGPFQNQEKLIPKTIINALLGKKIPIYGDGLQIRDWLYVIDHVKALIKVVLERPIGESFNICGLNQVTNLELVSSICNILDKKLDPSKLSLSSFSDLITFVDDRPGHDQRYAIDSFKITSELGWKPSESFESGLTKTVNWYLNNEWWWK